MNFDGLPVSVVIRQSEISSNERICVCGVFYYADKIFRVDFVKEVRKKLLTPSRLEQQLV